MLETRDRAAPQHSPPKAEISSNGAFVGGTDRPDIREALSARTRCSADVDEKESWYSLKATNLNGPSRKRKI